jgi:hypothetical protein
VAAFFVSSWPLLIVEPLKVQGGTGSTVAPIAIR